MKMEKKWSTLPNSGLFGDWNNNFEWFPFFSCYYYFIEIYVTSLDEYDFRSWKGWVESSIIFSWSLKKLPAYCDPNPHPYFDKNIKKPHCNFIVGTKTKEKHFYWYGRHQYKYNIEHEHIGQNIEFGGFWTPSPAQSSPFGSTFVGHNQLLIRRFLVERVILLLVQHLLQQAIFNMASSTISRTLFDIFQQAIFKHYAVQAQLWFHIFVVQFYFAAVLVLF